MLLDRILQVWKKCCFEHMAQFVNMNNEIKSGDKNNFIEWLLFNPKWELFSDISWQEQDAFRWGDGVRFVLDEHT